MLARISGMVMTVALFFRMMAGGRSEDDSVRPTSSVFIAIQDVGRVAHEPRIEVSNDSNIQVEYSVKSTSKGRELLLSANGKDVDNQGTTWSNEYPDRSNSTSSHDERIVAIRVLVKDQLESSHDLLIEIELGEGVESGAVLDKKV